MKVLVLDADLLPALAVIRSLGRRGVALISASVQDKPLGSYSKYAKQHRCYPCPLQESQAFINWAREQLADPDIALIIPVTERTLVPLARSFTDELNRARLAVPPLDALETVLDKAHAEALVTSLDIPNAKGWEVNQLGELQTLLPELSYPLVIKPARSIAENAAQGRVPLTVRYAHSHEDTLRIGAALLEHGHLLLQPYFRGVGVGIELIAAGGEILYAFQHQRLHEVPLTGGGSSYRKSTAIYPPLLEASRKIIAALAWHGVAMVEFKLEPNTGEFIFIEVNGRFWGSLPLAVAAGADFPWMLYQLYTKNGVESCAPYRHEILCRKLSSDLSWYEAVLRRDTDRRLVQLPDTRSLIRDSLTLLLPRHYFDAQSWRDPLPGFIDLRQIACQHWRRFSALLREQRYRRRFLRHSRPAHIHRALTGARKVLFICYGNINRSAAAQALAEQLQPAQRDMEFASAGFHAVVDRPADPRMVRAAARESIDLTSSRSCLVTPPLLHWADLIFIMEVPQMERLERIAPNLYAKTFLLGTLASPQDKSLWEIPDPYNQSEQVYQATFERLRAAIAALYGGPRPRPRGRHEL